MAGDKVLVLGATGPAGICVVRELVLQRQATIVYARNPAKVPEDLQSESLVEIVKGEMTDQAALAGAISHARAVISLLGPTSRGQPANAEFADYYGTAVVPLMRAHGVARLLAVGTTSIYRQRRQRRQQEEAEEAEAEEEEDGDRPSLTRDFFVLLVKWLAHGAYWNMLELERYFDQLRQGGGGGGGGQEQFRWTVFRVGNLLGSSDGPAWQRDRDGPVYVGPVGAPGWSSWINRSVLARWLVQQVDRGHSSAWVTGFPAVSQRAA